MTPLPQGFVDYVSRYPQLEILARSLDSEPEVSIRLNPAKTHGASSSAVIAAALAGAQVDWCRSGRYLVERPAFTFDPAIHQGLYYVQDASSMAIDAVVRQLSEGRPVRYLDACAAPGGKTTTVLAALDPRSLVVANEYDSRRADILAENVAKWGASNVVVTRGTTARFTKLKDFFDIVAVDAPCSGEGMMRKDEHARHQWSAGLVNECAATQREIVANVWQALRPGGYLIYSTCTFNLTEDEQNLQWIIDSYGAESVPVTVLDSVEGVCKGIDTEAACYRFVPGRIKGEGLFVAVVRKPGMARAAAVKCRPSKPVGAERALKDMVARDCDFAAIGSEIYALPRDLAPEMRHLASILDVVSMGVHAATIKGKDIVPTHQLALSDLTNHGYFARVDLDTDDAIKYLRRESIALPDATPKGFVMLWHDGSPLGMVKNLGNRCNSLLPKEWRILSQI